LIEAFNAGVDVMLWPGDDYFDLMERAIADGRISEERLNASVARVLAMKAAQAPAGDAGARAVAAGAVSCGEGGAGDFGRELGRRSLTLLRNREGVLPLDPARTRRVFVLLASARGERGLPVIEPFLAGLRARGCEVTVRVNGNCLDLLKREESGERFDALVVLFEQSTHGIKNTMRPVGEMGECMWMVQGLTTMKPVVVSLGSPYLLNDMPWAHTCINAYGSSAFSLEALAAALFGEIPFLGKCPVDAGGEWVPPGGLSGAVSSVQGFPYSAFSSIISP
jgi:beta-N-acetylhexosaminidase